MHSYDNGYAFDGSYLTLKIDGEITEEFDVSKAVERIMDDQLLEKSICNGTQAGQRIKAIKNKCEAL